MPRKNNTGSIETPAKGKVIFAFGNLLQTTFDKPIRQGEVGFVNLKGVRLKAEVIEIAQDVAKIQVFENTEGIHVGTPIEFQSELLEAELGPGLLTSIFDGLQNPLENVAERVGLFLERGIYLPSLDRERKWEFKPTIETGVQVRRGDILGVVQEGRFSHKIMVPFRYFHTFELTWIASPGLYTIEEPIATAIDGYGNKYTFTMLQKWPVKIALHEGEKIKPTKMMDCGLRTIDTQFPLLKGGTFCSPGPFGAGKTVLQHHLSKYSSVDIVVVVACGERAGEVVEVLREFPHLIDPHTGESLMSRTVIICNTSSMPVAARESSVYMGTTIGEYYRQMGLDVLVLADSTSRWAQALREMSGRLEEIPGDEAFPAYLSSRIAELYERSGAFILPNGKEGSLTIGGAVSPAGGNFEEPVTQATLAVVGAFLGLSRERSDSRRYPAIHPNESWSKYVDQVGKDLSFLLPGWGQLVKRASKLLQEGSQIARRMEVVGVEGTHIDDFITYLKAELYDFVYLQQNAFDKEDAYCPLKRQAALFKLVNLVFDTSYYFTSHDSAREFFLNIQNKIKNLNYLAFDSNEYTQGVEEVEKLLLEGK